MSFKPNDIVEIVRPTDLDDDDQESAVYTLWGGYRARVMPLVSPYIDALGQSMTKLQPIEERPDAHEPEIDPYAWFYWDTEDLRLVESAPEE